MSFFNREEYDDIHRLVFEDGFPGYRPGVVEYPNGDAAVDAGKCYAHVNHATIQHHEDRGYLWEARSLEYYYRQALNEARRVCNRLGVPKQFQPGSDSTMRVLKYPPGAGSAPHTDFDLLTLSLFRDPEDEGFEFLSYDGDADASTRSALHWLSADFASPGVHFGELWPLIMGELAQRHCVKPLKVSQRSIVFFVVPDHSAKLPSGVSVGDWMHERKSRSRGVAAGSKS